MSENWLGIVWLVILLVANAFFVGAEFAVISAKRSQIEPLADRGNPAAKLALCQLGITVCSLLILNVSEPAIKYALEGPLSWTGLSPELVSIVAFIIALLLVTYLHVVLGEMVPKNAAFTVPDRAVLLLAPPLVLISRIFKPVIWAMNAAANGILRLFGVQAVDEAASAFTIDEVSTIVETSKREGLLFDPTGAISRAFEFTERRVRELQAEQPLEPRPKRRVTAHMWPEVDGRAAAAATAPISGAPISGAPMAPLAGS